MTWGWFFRKTTQIAPSKNAEKKELCFGHKAGTGTGGGGFVIPI